MRNRNPAAACLLALLLAACAATGSPGEVATRIRELEQQQAEFTIELKYHDGAPVIKEIARVSTPGRRVYSRIKDLPKVYGGLGISILSTPRGVMSDAEAREAHVGGEVLCTVF